MLSFAFDLNQNIALFAENGLGGYGRFLLNQIRTSRNRFDSSEFKEPESSNEYVAENTPSGLCESLCTRVVAKRRNMAGHLHRSRDFSGSMLEQHHSLWNALT